MNVPSSQANTRILLDELCCPVNSESLSEAVSLVPCAHKIQEIAAQTIFGATHNGWQVEPGKKCPVCRVSVQGYMIDHTTRNVVRQLCALSEYDLGLMVTKIKTKLAENTLSLAKEEGMDISYPGKPARFVFGGGSWQAQELGALLCRSMNFFSSTKGSLLKEFDLLGYKDGGILISVTFSGLSILGNSPIEQYLKKYDIHLSDDNRLSGFYMSCNQEQTIALFNMIAENNEIPSSHFETIKDILAKGYEIGMAKLAEKTLSVAREEVVDIPYPGKPAKFVHAKGNWQFYVSRDSFLCRSMNFISSTKGSLLKEFDLLGYKDGGVLICVTFSERLILENSPIEQYLIKYDIHLSDENRFMGSYMSCNQEQTIALFNMIAENNEIPSSHFETIKDILTKAYHIVT